MPLNDLVPLAPSDRPATQLRAVRRPNADFVAHLIATRGRAPQTRTHRRAESAEAIAAYGVVGESPAPSGRALSRSL
jgi:hypothetical protein